MSETPQTSFFKDNRARGLAAVAVVAVIWALFAQSSANSHKEEREALESRLSAVESENETLSARLTEREEAEADIESLEVRLAELTPGGGGFTLSAALSLPVGAGDPGDHGTPTVAPPSAVTVRSGWSTGSWPRHPERCWPRRRRRDDVVAVRLRLLEEPRQRRAAGHPAADGES